MRICANCNYFLTEIETIVSSAKRLERLFNGLAEESSSDLSIKRLNAYRAHFDLQTMISEDSNVTVRWQDKSSAEEVEYIEYKVEEEELIEEQPEDDTETIVEELVQSIDGDFDESSIIQEDYMDAEEIYLAEVEDDSEEMEEEVYASDENLEIQSLSQNPTRTKFTPTIKTEEEELFTFQCHICPHPEFLKMKLLTLHCKTIHGCLPVVKCCSDKCEATLSTWRRLLIHKEKHFPSSNSFKCPQCPMVYKHATALNKHIESHKRNFICVYCSKSFKEAKILKTHEWTHLKPIEERRNHQCPYEGCVLKFITKQAMQNHYAMKHEKQIQFYCSFVNCEKSFYTKRQMREHLRNHGDRSLQCDVCGYKTKTKSALNAHKDSHKVGETFQCDLCQAAFSVYRRLKAHMSKFSLLIVI
jgi:hypothetical protein